MTRLSRKVSGTTPEAFIWRERDRMAVEVYHGCRLVAHAADDASEEQRVRFGVWAAAGGGRQGAHLVEHVEGEREEAAARAAEAEAGVEEPEVGRAGPREDVVDERLGGCGAAVRAAR
jgi:hypothetical protein